jgi:hypothetical protein
VSTGSHETAGSLEGFFRQTFKHHGEEGPNPRTERNDGPLRDIARASDGTGALGVRDNAMKVYEFPAK